MNSLDTHLLVYAANSAAPEHAKALGLVNTMLAHSTEWILADQVLWEFYKALRHPKKQSWAIDRDTCCAPKADMVRSLCG